MARFPNQTAEPLLRVRGQSGSMGLGVSMRGILTLSVCPSGLRVGIMQVFGPFCRYFFVPWEAFSVTRKTVLFWPVAKLQFGSPGVGSLTIPAHVANRLARAALGRWPEAGPFPEEKHHDTLRRLLTQWAAITCVAALFFTLVPLAVAPTGARPPIVVAILFPAIVFWRGCNREIRSRKELKAKSGRSAIRPRDQPQRCADGRPQCAGRQKCPQVSRNCSPGHARRRSSYFQATDRKER